MRIKLLPLLLALPLFASCPEEHLLGDWNNIPYLDLHASYWNDLQGNPVGGLRQSLANAGCFYLTVEADLRRGLSLFASASYWTGQNLSQSIGNQFTVSTWWSPTTYYLDELYLQQSFSNTLIRFGRMCADTEFASSSLFANYITLAINGNPISLFFNTPFPADPFALWGAYFQTTHNPITLKLGIYNENPKALDKSYHGFNWSFTSSFLLLSQLDLQTPTGTYRVGAYYLTGSSPLFLGGTTTGNYGFYTVCEQQLTCPLTAWAMGLIAPSDRNQLPYFLATGLIYNRTHLGFAFGRFSPQFDTAISSRVLTGAVGNLTTEPETFETVLELNHQFHLRPGLYLTPLAQYIHAPGSTSIPDTLVLGLQLTAIL